MGCVTKSSVLSNSPRGAVTPATNKSSEEKEECVHWWISFWGDHERKYPPKRTQRPTKKIDYFLQQQLLFLIPILWPFLCRCCFVGGAVVLCLCLATPSAEEAVPYRRERKLCNHPPHEQDLRRRSWLHYLGELFSTAACAMLQHSRHHCVRLSSSSSLGVGKWGSLPGRRRRFRRIDSGSRKEMES